MHDHDHSSSSQRIGWAFFLNLRFTIIEFIGGWLTNSVDGPEEGAIIDTSYFHPCFDRCSRTTTFSPQR